MHPIAHKLPSRTVFLVASAVTAWAALAVADGRGGGSRRPAPNPGFPAPAAGQGLVVLGHVDPGLSSLRRDVHFGSAGAPVTFERGTSALAFGDLRGVVRPVGPIRVVLTEPGAAVPNMPSMFSGPSLAEGGEVILLLFRGTRPDEVVPNWLNTPAGTAPDATHVRLLLSIARPLTGEFEVCSGGASWFTGRVDANGFGFGSGFAERPRNWNRDRTVDGGSVALEVRTAPAPRAAACSGTLHGTATVALRAGSTTHLVVTAGANGPGAILACAVNAPYACTSHALAAP